MRKNIISVMAAVAFMPAASFAAAPTLSDVLDASGISITGHASGSWAYNHASGDGPGSGGVTVNQFTFDQAELTISKLPAEGFGALVDVYAGQDVAGDTYNYGNVFIGAQLPQNILPTGGFNKFDLSVSDGSNLGGGSEINIHQAYVQYATGGLTVIGGKFATLAGYEVASDALNTNATRSINYSQQAFTLTGVRAGYKFNDMVTVYAGLSNGVLAPTITTGSLVYLPNTIDLQPQKTVEVGVALAPLKGLTINVTDYRGTELATDATGGTAFEGKVNLLDVVAAYTIGNLSVAYNGDYNTSKVKGAGVTAKYLGHAIYTNYQITKSLRAGVRGELTSAWNSGAGGPKIDRREVTLTGGYSASKNFDLISDVRYAGVQDDPSIGNAHQLSYVLKAVYKF